MAVYGSADPGASGQELDMIRLSPLSVSPSYTLRMENVSSQRGETRGVDN